MLLGRLGNVSRRAVLHTNGPIFRLQLNGNPKHRQAKASSLPCGHHEDSFDSAIMAFRELPLDPQDAYFTSPTVDVTQAPPPCVIMGKSGLVDVTGTHKLANFKTALGSLGAATESKSWSRKASASLDEKLTRMEQLRADLDMNSDEETSAPSAMLIRTLRDQLHQAVVPSAPLPKVFLTRSSSRIEGEVPSRQPLTATNSPGHTVRSFDSLADVDPHKLRDLIHSAFGRELVPHYMNALHQRLARVYVAGWDQGQYHGCAIVTDEGIGVPYLDKLAVSRDARGMGAGRVLWQAMRRDQRGLFWRSRSDNTLNDWYFRHAHGSLRVTPEWCAGRFGYTAFWAWGRENEDGRVIGDDFKLYEKGGALATDVGQGGQCEMRLVESMVEVTRRKPNSFLPEDAKTNSRVFSLGAAAQTGESAALVGSGERD